MKMVPFAELPSSGARGVPLRGVYLERLQRLLRLRQEHEQDLNTQGLHLLDRSIFTAFCDCRDLGVAEEARRILRDAKFVVDQPRMPLAMPEARPR